MGRQAALLDFLHRCEPDVLPAALPGPSGHATPLYRLSRGLRLLELRVELGCVPVLRVVPVLHRRHRLEPCQGPCRDREEPLERIRGYLGMDPYFAAARAHVRAAPEAGRLGKGPRALSAVSSEKNGPGGNAGAICYK